MNYSNQKYRHEKEFLFLTPRSFLLVPLSAIVYPTDKKNLTRIFNKE